MLVTKAMEKDRCETMEELSHGKSGNRSRSRQQQCVHLTGVKDSDLLPVEVQLLFHCSRGLGKC